MRRRHLRTDAVEMIGLRMRLNATAVLGRFFSPTCTSDVYCWHLFGLLQSPRRAHAKLSSFDFFFLFCNFGDRIVSFIYTEHFNLLTFCSLNDLRVFLLILLTSYLQFTNKMVLDKNNGTDRMARTKW